MLGKRQNLCTSSLMSRITNTNDEKMYINNTIDKINNVKYNSGKKTKKHESSRIKYMYMYSKSYMI